MIPESGSEVKYTFDSTEDAGDDVVGNSVPLDSILRKVPRPLRFENAPIEATGLSLDIWARATIFMTTLFLGPALLKLATEAAQENCELGDECRIYGFRPSSLLTNIMAVSGLVCSVLLPLFGAIVDHTRYRRQVGAGTAAGLVFIAATQSIVGRHTWFLVAGLQIGASMLYNPHITATYAYTSELSNDSNKQAQYNTQLFVIMYVSTLIFLVEVLGLSALLGTDDVGTARISQLITSSTSAVFFYFAWTYLFQDRPALSEVPAGSKLLSCGFRKVFDTSYRIRTQYRALKWFMLSLVFADSALGALVIISTTFMTQVLQMTSKENGLLFLIVLLCGIPGSKLGGWLAVRLNNPLLSAKICDCFLVGVTTTASLVLSGPSHKRYAYILAGFWGVGLGWLPPMQTTTFISIIPKGQEAELMGMFLLCGQVLSWLPPLVFTALNEAGFDMAYGLLSLNLFFLLGFVCRSTMGRYEDALEEVSPTHLEMENLEQTRSIV